MGVVTDRYELVTIGNDLKNGHVVSFSHSNFHRELKDALNALVSMNNDKFDEDLVAKKQNAFLIQDALVVDTQTREVMAAKHYLRLNDVFGMDAGVYLRINPKLITPRQFEEMTGCTLPDGPAAAIQAGYYRLSGASRLLQQRSLLDRVRNFITKHGKKRTRGKGIN